MMETTPKNIAEAKRALDEYLRRERHVAQVRQNRSGATFQAEGGSDTSFDKGDDWGRITEARASALRYIALRSKGIRPVRQIDESNQPAVEGRDSALAFIEKRKRSVIRK